MECLGGTAIVGAFDMSLDAIKLLLTYEHANCPPIDINKPCIGINATALDFTRMNIVKFTRFRDEVAITGKEATNCYKTWTTVEPFDIQIEKLKELEALLLSKGAVEEDVEKSHYEFCVNQSDRMPREDGLQVLGLKSRAKVPSYLLRMRKKLLVALAVNCVLLSLGVQLLVHLTLSLCILLFVGKGKDLPFDVSSLFGIDDLLCEKSSPSWYRKRPAHINDGSTRMFQAFEGRPHLHCAHSGVSPAVGLKVKLYIPLPNDTYACLAGWVTKALPVPTENDLKRSKHSKNPSFLYKQPCPFPWCKHKVDDDHLFSRTGSFLDQPCLLSRNGSYKELLQKFGAVHGQEVQCRLKFTHNLGDGRDESVVAFFAGYSVFHVTLRFTDGVENKWVMSSIQPVG